MIYRGTDTNYAFWEKLFPNQQYFREEYRGHKQFEMALYDLLASHARDFSANNVELLTSPNAPFEKMSTPPHILALFDMLIKLTGAKTLLEIGTFVGHSAMQFARMLGEGGQVTTVEVGHEFAEIARKNFRENGLGGRIDLFESSAGPAMDEMQPHSFDVIFIDGGKQDYLAMTKQAIGLVSERGIIVVDDVFFHGDVLNDPPRTDKGRGCKELLDYAKSNEQFDRLLLPIANGILVLFNFRDKVRA